MNRWIVMGHALVGALWIGWIAYWIVSARGTAITERSESRGSRASYIVPLEIGVVLLALPLPGIGRPMNIHLLPESVLTLIVGLCLLIMGLAIAVLARRQLGGYWSGRITLKAGHRLIQNGPYAVVRHPMYSGILLGLFGTVITTGTLQSLLGFAIVLIAIARKLLLEEHWLVLHFGEEYEQYRRRIKALIPFLV